MYVVTALTRIFYGGGYSWQNGCHGDKPGSHLPVTLLSIIKVDHLQCYTVDSQGRLSICYYTCCSKVYFPRWMCSTRTRIVLLSLSFKSSRLCLILRAQYVRCILMWNSSRSCLISAVMTAGFSWGSLNWPVMNNKTCSDFKVSIYLVQSYHCKIVLVAPQIVFKGLYRERKRCAWRNNIQ